MTDSALHLLIDAGNSRIKWSLVTRAGEILAAGAFGHADRVAANTLPDTPNWSALPTPSGAWISNVAGPAVATQLETLLAAHWPTLPVHTIRTQPAQCGVVNSYRDSAQLGSDRWAGLLGAHAAYPGEALLIVTFGTATTFEALRADGRFIGGLIAPGWAVMMESLGQRAAQLPWLTTGMVDALGPTWPSRQGGVFMQETAESIVAGCRLAQVSLVESAWRAWRAELASSPGNILGAQEEAPAEAPAEAHVRCVIGGGDARHIAPGLTIPYTRHDHLVLAGLGVIANSGGSSCGAS